MGELIQIWVISIKATAQSTNPERTKMVFMNCPNPIIAQAVGIIRVVPVSREVLAIVFIQAILCPKPHESVAVLKNGKRTILGETVFHCYVFESDIVQNERGLQLKTFIRQIIIGRW